jgi:hypothetical protein
MYIILLLIIIILLIIFINQLTIYPIKKQNTIHPVINQNNVYSTNPTDTLLNPYVPPIKFDDNENYKQIGYVKNDTRMIPLFGKPTMIKKDRWYYYTIIDNIKVPLNYNNKDCSSELGCDMLYTGDKVKVNDNIYFTNIYKNNMIYNPNNINII